MDFSLSNLYAPILIQMQALYFVNLSRQLQAHSEYMLEVCTRP
jgi:hypothetical protein